ncbi:MAG: MerR family transcriptional regulator [Treponema sp.]|jgi:DNA-binding transcriptional MerR regulator|nr:MerR family transcriptional regulator [Treponema sp.]
MTSYTLGDLERILGLKNYVIRYWEKEIPLLQPHKNQQGRRLYANQDLHLLFRLKYLLYDRHFTLEGARNQLFREVSGEQQDLRAQIGALRSDLIALYVLVKGISPKTGVPKTQKSPDVPFSTVDS